MWKEINYKNIKTFRLDDEPELIHVFSLGENEYMIVHEDAFHLDTGKVEFVNEEDLQDKYKIEIKKETRTLTEDLLKYKQRIDIIKFISERAKTKKDIE